MISISERILSKEDLWRKVYQLQNVSRIMSAIYRIPSGSSLQNKSLSNTLLFCYCTNPDLVTEWTKMSKIPNCPGSEFL